LLPKWEELGMCANLLVMMWSPQGEAMEVVKIFTKLWSAGARLVLVFVAVLKT
jgi:hypothetical protein